MHIEKAGTTYRDKITKLPFALVRDRGTIFFSIGGMHRKSALELITDKNKRSQVLTVLGGEDASYDNLEKIFTQLQKNPKFQGIKWRFAGQSLGGAYAQYLALRTKQRAICFNSFPIGAGLQAKIPAETLNRAQQYCTHFVVEKDPFNNNCLTTTVDRALSAMGVRTPGSFGRCLTIPSAYKNFEHTHNYVLGSLCNYLGYDKRMELEDYVAKQNITPDPYHDVVADIFDIPLRG
jgi:hypothetical protein